jgi:UDP-N-acetylmuramoyl-L-alanyl-D-glutamate--2,6-diaminopimelate ligase
MGQVATELADVAFVTSDNPRNEAPEAIIKEIVAGIDRTNYKVIVDRQKAICAAIDEAGAEDSVVIAGKGHENYQLVKGETRHFDDAEAALACLN